ncbi:MAG: hypothetical protein WCG29_06095 [Desulfomonile sp.]|jgi:hypothetical protein|nr:hypothetical protein [Deltaproteobacteria bacterium]
MNKKSWFLILGIVFVSVTLGSGGANAFFVATAQNFRGALYQGFGPTPGHASEMAIVKCSQDSFAPRSCHVIGVRMECPPPICAPPMRKPMTKISGGYPTAPSWGRPMP